MAENSQDWSAYWQGRESETALEGVGVETDQQIASFWRAHFKNAQPKDCLVDLGCGAGTVSRRAAEAGFTHITGVDFSAEATRLLQSHLPNATIAIAPLASTGLAEQSFAWVTSQYGVEYGGDTAFAEAARLLAPGGQLVALCHLVDGGIYAEVLGDIAFAEALQATNYIPHGIALTAQLFTPAASIDQVAAGQAEEDFQQAVDALTPLSASRPDSLATHLHAGFTQLVARRHAYKAEDITGWLEGMAQEIDRYAGRMSAMRDAALGDTDIARIFEIFERHGLRDCSAEKFLPPGDTQAIAWIVLARRKAD